MDALKRHWFWIVCGTLSLGCGAFYFVGAFSMKSDNAVLAQELSDLLDQKPAAWQRTWAASPAEIPGDQVVEAHRQFAKTLGEEVQKSQDLLRAPQRWQGIWTPEEIADYVTKPTMFSAAYSGKVSELTKPSPSRPSGYERLGFLLSSGTGTNSFDFAKTDDLHDEQIALEAKQLMIQLELVRILNDAKVLRLPDEGIRFVSDLASMGGGGSGGGGGIKTAAAAAAAKDPLRRAHPFLLKVDLDLNDLPKLVQGLSSSTFNLHLKSLKIEKLQDAKLRDELVDPPVQLVKTDRRNEIIRVEIGCEALELLPPPEKKA